MFTNNKPSTECLGTTVIQSKSSDVVAAGYIEIPAAAQGANSVLVQVYYNPNELPSGMTDNDLAGVPLVTIDEFNDAPVNAEWATPGMKLVNFGMFLIETPLNIGRAKIIPFNAEVNVYVALSFYS